MREFTYLKPATLKEALGQMQLYAGHILPYAGGTDVMVQLRNGSKKLAGVQYFLDLGGLAELKGEGLEGESVHIGAMQTHQQLCQSPLLKEHAPMLAEACSTVGALQIRNTGTIGGNVCNASVAADSLAPLAALGAICRLVSAAGERELPLAEFITGPEQTCILPGELLAGLSFGSLKGWGTGFFKLGRRRALAISRITAAAALRLEGGVVKEARVAPGCVFASPRRSAPAEGVLLGKAPSLALFNAAGEAAAEEMVAVTGVRWSTEYKQPVLASVVSSALCLAAGIPMEG